MTAILDWCMNIQQCSGETSSSSITLPNLLAGESTLQDLLEQQDWEYGRREMNKVRFIFESIALSVHHMHTFGIVHGDLKPKNCVQFYDRYRLIDFEEVKTSRMWPKFVCMQ
jgi:serine/threonine protein kinase